MLPALLVGVAFLGAAAPAQARDSIRLRFQKECQGTTCTGTLITAEGLPVPGTSVSASLSLLWDEHKVIGFAATETISSSSRGSFTMNHLGVNDLNADPPAIHVVAVVSGSWNGIPLAGAAVRIRAHGVPPSSVRGSLLIQPRSQATASADCRSVHPPDGGVAPEALGAPEPRSGRMVSARARPGCRRAARPAARRRLEWTRPPTATARSAIARRPPPGRGVAPPMPLSATRTTSRSPMSSTSTVTSVAWAWAAAFSIPSSMRK